MKTTTKAELGITEWELSNGVRVVLRPTTFKQDEIVFRAISPGGTSLASDADFIAAETADAVISRGGLGKLTESNLEKALAGKNAFVEPEIGDTDEGLRGGASRRDLETMFQLIYLTFTQPRADPEAFKTLTAQWAATLANRQALPDAVFGDAVEEAVTQGHPRARPLTPAQLPQMRLDTSLAFYKNRFADASDFTFVFVGTIDLDAIKPLVERYLGSLPSLRKPGSCARRRHPPARRHRRTAGQERGGPAEPGVGGVHRTVPERLRRIASCFARWRRRSKATCSGRCARIWAGPTASASRRTSSSVPRRVSRHDLVCLRSRAPRRPRQRAVPRHRRVPAQRAVRGAGGGRRLALARDLETNSRSNSYLLNQLTYKYEYGEDPGEVFRLPEFYDQITPAAIRDAAQTYLDPSRYVKVTLLPER